MIPFGKQLHTTRTALGMTQDDLALELGVDKQTVSNWECERTQPWPNRKVEVLTKLLNLQRGLTIIADTSVPGATSALYRDGELIARLYTEGSPAWREPSEPAPVRARVIDRI